MSQGEKAVTRFAAVNLVRRWSAPSPRTLWTGLALTGASGAGFGAAVLAGVSPTFGQPLATLLGGAGVLAAGTLAYVTGQRSRAQADAHHRIDSRHAKESALRDRYTAIAAQIANESAAIRQAGIYALTALADDWHAFGEDDERQVCINLLQWYLRVPFPEGDDPEKPDLSEREIRQTIVAILTERRHRPVEHPKSWAAAVISLHETSLPNCVLRYSNLSGLDLANANLAGGDLTVAKLTGANLIGTNLTSANLAAANLTGAVLDRAEMNRADLTDASLTDAKLTRTNLTGAVLDRADLTRADLTGTNLTSASLRRADLTDTTLLWANLADANLKWANLTGTALPGADLTDANLTDANLTDANLMAANLIGANLTDAQLLGVTYNELTKWPEGFTPPPEGFTSQ